MKRLFVLLLALWPLCFFSQTIYWEKDLTGQAVSLAINSNNKIGYVVNVHLNFQAGMLDSSNIIWNQPASGFIASSSFTGNSYNGGFYLAEGDSVSMISENGIKSFLFRMPTGTNSPFLVLASDKEHYLVNNTSSSSPDKRVSVYDYDNNLISTWPTLNKDTYKPTIKKDRVCLSGNQYGGGFYTNVHGHIATYDLAGKILWTDSIPDCINNLNCIDDTENVYYVSEYLDYSIPQNPSMGLLLKKYNSNGTMLWQKSWDGDLNKQGLVIPYSITYIPGGDKGFIVAGAVTRPESVGGDINEAQGFILRIDKDGNIVWKYKKPIDAVNRYFAGYLGLDWDKNNYLTACYTESDRTGGNDMNFFSEIIKYSIDGVTTVEREEKVIPTSFSLSQNYPNPFNPSTTINFSITKPGHVSLKVYDLLGHEVSTLVNENLNCGSYKTTFDAKNLASGVYVYQLRTGDFASSKKMVLIK